MRYRCNTVEGNIGAGKTSLATMLSKDYGGKLILEQFADNPFLPHFYKNPKQYAFPLELFFLAERYQQLKDVAQSPDLFNSCVVTDYLFAKSHLFASINLEDEEMKLLNGWRRSCKPHCLIQTFFYLHTPVPKLLENIEKRGRPYEKDITDSYLKEIQDGYFDLFKTLNHLRIVVLDTSHVDFVNNPSHYKAVLNLLQQEHEPGTKVISRLTS